ncbi:hypothetical protein DL93DRAFT_2165191 [Clavulina sp. PMI_390]|nr:hypothetical protein DL93DRAFT_2165191 [Clavulina sp. PMI_390]
MNLDYRSLRSAPKSTPPACMDLQRSTRAAYGGMTRPSSPPCAPKDPHLRGFQPPEEGGKEGRGGISDLIAQIKTSFQALQKENDELRNENEVLKASHSNEIEKLKESFELRSVQPGRYERGDSISLCVIDGDGCVFSDNYLKQGDTGGKLAAGALQKAINNSSDIQGSLIVVIFMNLYGLRDALTGADVCSRDEFIKFLIGFNQSSELFSIVDVGHGKEKADAKIRGGHDSGYVPTLNSLITEGHLHKIIIMDYGQNAQAIKELNLPDANFDGVFMMSPIGLPENSNSVLSEMTNGGGSIQTPVAPLSPTTTSASHKSVEWPSASRASPEFTKAKAATYTWQTARRQDTRDKGNLPRVDRSKPMIKQIPKICNDYYLDEGCYLVSCPHSHNYNLTPNDIKLLRWELKNIKCKGPGCRGKECWYSHDQNHP